MHKNKLVIAVAVAAVCLAAAGVANAVCYGTLTAQWDGVYPGQGVGWNAYNNDTSSSNSGSTTAGVYNFKFISATNAAGYPTDPTQENPLIALDAGERISTHCIDLSQFVGGEENWDVCDATDAPLPTTYCGGVSIDGTKEDLLQRLFWQYPAILSGENQKAAARQIAVWEIVFDDGQDPTDSSSDFYITGNDGASALAKTMLTTIQTSWSWSGKNKPTIYAFVSDDEQDQIWLVPGGGGYIPEPVTMLGMFLGLGSVGAYIRRRRMA